MSKMLLLTLNEQEEKIIDKIISALADHIHLEPMQITPVSVLSFPGLEIGQSQHRVCEAFLPRRDNRQSVFFTQPVALIAYLIIAFLVAAFSCLYAFSIFLCRNVPM